MRHVDDGTLHALLDGALTELDPEAARRVREHLDACAACRERLEEERRVRDRAEALLGGDDPLAGVTLPTLDELRREAGVRKPGGMPTRVAWAWAATVVLSLGIGYGVGVVRSIDPGDAPAGASEADASGPDDVADPAADPAPGREARGAGETDAARPDGGDSRSADGSSRSAQARPVAPGAPLARDAASPLADAASPRADRDEQVREPPTASAEAEKVAAGREVEAADTAPLGLRRLEEELARPVELVTVPTLPADSPAVDVLAPTGAVPSAVGRATPALEGRLESSPQPASAGDAFAPVRSARDDALRFTGGTTPPTLVLPGFQVVEVVGEEVWPGQPGVRLVQALPDGRRVELRVAGPPADGSTPVRSPPETTPSLRPGWARALMMLHDGWVDLRGPLPEAELRRLLASLR
jgi:hypothetical protein